MKSITIISIILMLCACNSNASKVISSIPIKTEVLGLTLGDTSNEKAIENVLTKTTDQTILTDSQIDGIVTSVRAIPSSLIYYGGKPWHYIDITLNQDKIITEIQLIASFENIKTAKNEFDEVSQIITEKYGKGNYDEENQSVFWTDDTNFIGLYYEESCDINGNNRSFCTLFYTNKELYNTLENAYTSDF